MKKLLALILSVLTLVGCSTTKPTPPSVPVLVESVSRTAVAVDLMDNPQHRAEFEDVVMILDVFIAGGDLDPATLRLLFRDADPKIFLALLAGLDLYEAYFKEAVEKQMANREHLIPVLQALRNGIQQGLDITR